MEIGPDATDFPSSAWPITGPEESDDIEPETDDIGVAEEPARDAAELASAARATSLRVARERGTEREVMPASPRGCVQTCKRFAFRKMTNGNDVAAQTGHNFFVRCLHLFKLTRGARGTCVSFLREKENFFGRMVGGRSPVWLLRERASPL